ncbi:ATP cone domain-containing protein [Flavobacterium sp. LHD-80]|uniref:ATP cone domain-containing protein n=1 Tax=Flavobacterium sp. LHD-80 TaxID=3071411 RepID=UPI0027E1EB79|nr:ATP cone domain-containing protein [Flavobacterium sp. LHD-80]MDQ6470612.1 ATP cone domain-containing protein [Flavobacterium sp. LHD-80]
MKITKHSGHKVPFDKEKLKLSLKKTGAGTDLIRDSLVEIEKQMYDGITTKEIYKLAFAILKKTSNGFAARYNIKLALQMLGPAGFFFEKFISRLYAEDGFKTKINLTLQGKCVSHEVDIAIIKNNIITMIESSFTAAKKVLRMLRFLCTFFLVLMILKRNDTLYFLIMKLLIPVLS